MKKLIKFFQYKKKLYQIKIIIITIKWALKKLIITKNLIHII